MSGKTLKLEIELNYPLFLGMALFFHVLTFLIFSAPDSLFKFKLADLVDEKTPLKIHSIRTVGSKESKSLNNTYLDFNRALTKKDAVKEAKTQTGSPQKKLSLQDLSPEPKVAQMPNTPNIRPGSRPEVGPRKKAIEAISLRGREIQKFVRGSDAVALSGDDRTSGLANSDVMVKLEVPEGVNPDELNEYELMFYSFQRRTAINYVNSFYKNLDNFQRNNPHMKFPMTDTKQVMTGRLTYDEKGNIKQIKMIRWSNVDRLQDFFVDILKDMDTLHNPPQALWKKTGEFSIFFSLQING